MRHFVGCIIGASVAWSVANLFSIHDQLPAIIIGMSLGILGSILVSLWMT